MHWQDLLARSADGSFFSNLGALRSDRDRAARLRWAWLLRTDPLWRWVRQDGWAASALANNNPVLKPILGHLLERYLLDLNTRFSPLALLAFWSWAMEATGGTGTLASLWQDEASNLAKTCAVGELSLEDIVVQEARFVQILQRAREVLRQTGVPNSLDWAHRSVVRLGERRRGNPAGEPVGEVFARVVFAWARGHPSPLREAVLVDFRLGEQGKADTHVCPREPFDESFHEAAAYVADLVGRRRFHRLKFHPFWENLPVSDGETGLELPDEWLSCWPKSSQIARRGGAGAGTPCRPGWSRRRPSTRRPTAAHRR